MRENRRRFTRIACALLAALLLCVAAEPAQASEDRSPSVGQVIWDLAVLRPLGFVQVVVGLAVFIPAYPASLPFGAGGDVIRICIEGPVDQTFRRPLGEL